MTSKPEKADDDIDALEALESEEKEYLKVRLRALVPPPTTPLTSELCTGC
jgi:biotin synthase-like enzyme